MMTVGFASSNLMRMVCGRQEFGPKHTRAGPSLPYEAKHARPLSLVMIPAIHQVSDEA
jgi:hypothetical protein